MFLHLARPSGRYCAPGDGAIRAALSHFVTYDGNSYSCHARCCDQRCARVERYDPRTVIDAWLLEPHFCLAQGMSYNLIQIPNCLIIQNLFCPTSFGFVAYFGGAAASALAILSFMGACGWAGPPREHGALHGEQLLAPWVLALVASLV
jgi:hypothetical protein